MNEAVQKNKIMYNNTFFLFINRLHYNSAENEIRYIIVTATERGDRGECRIGFPSLTFQNPEEGGGSSIIRVFKYKYSICCFLWVLMPN